MRGPGMEREKKTLFLDGRKETRQVSQEKRRDKLQVQRTRRRRRGREVEREEGRRR